MAVKIVTIGQYLQPSSAHYPVKRFVRPEEFRQWEEEALTWDLRPWLPAVCSQFFEAKAVGTAFGFMQV